MDDCKECEFLNQCRNGEKVKCPWVYLEKVYNPFLQPFNKYKKSNGGVKNKING